MQFQVKWDFYCPILKRRQNISVWRYYKGGLTYTSLNCFFSLLRSGRTEPQNVVKHVQFLNFQWNVNFCVFVDRYFNWITRILYRNELFSKFWQACFSFSCIKPTSFRALVPLLAPLPRSAHLSQSFSPLPPARLLTFTDALPACRIRGRFHNIWQGVPFAKSDFEKL